ncbi:MAG TPA: Rrf2 family transcriptional regulator [Thermodesulfobacteriota bacterium]
MKRSGRFAVALHVLVHLAESPDEPATSEHLARCARTNPVVVRRTMAGLREAGLVTSARGPGGGWRLARDAGSVTLRDVYAALGERLLFATGKAPVNPGCVVEHALTGALDDFFRRAEATLAERFGRITLADLSADIGRLTAQRRGRRKGT